MTTPQHSPRTSQQGFVLIVALILLLVLTILGLAAAQTSSVEERMAGNDRNHSMAFEAGEAGLSAAYSGILQGLWTNADFATNANGLYLLSTCCGGSGYTSAWTVPGAWGGALPITTPVPGLNIPEVSQQPIFMVEELPPVAPPGTNLAVRQNGSGTPPVQPYRITAFATGGDQTTHVILQTVVIQ